jgi:hypothetical protein
MSILIEHSIVLFCVILAILFVGWKLQRSVRRNQSGCHCGSEKGCAKLMASMEELDKDKR